MSIDRSESDDVRLLPLKIIKTDLLKGTGNDRRYISKSYAGSARKYRQAVEAKVVL